MIVTDVLVLYLQVVPLTLIYLVGVLVAVRSSIKRFEANIAITINYWASFPYSEQYASLLQQNCITIFIQFSRFSQNRRVMFLLFGKFRMTWSRERAILYAGFLHDF